ncbi:MAG: thiamine diphosphokinase [Puniceicoccales bacterium]|jgi:thiamine pyrophosphokinase|nr:thiamine diphosphokinase [Puniceicoccales bacterium]
MGAGRHFAIVANGQVDFSSGEEIAKLISGKTLIALDGAANFLRSIAVAPQICIGDFDSIDEETAVFLKKSGSITVGNSCQDTTDLEKALLYVSEAACESAVVIHALGGRQDHAIGNVTFLKKYAKAVANLSILTAESKIFYVEDTLLSINGAHGLPCGFFGFPLATVTSVGLRYEMQNYRLELGSSESVANSFRGSQLRAIVLGQCIVSCGRAADGPVVTPISPTSWSHLL